MAWCSQPPEAIAGSPKHCLSDTDWVSERKLWSCVTPLCTLKSQGLFAVVNIPHVFWLPSFVYVHPSWSS